MLLHIPRALGSSGPYNLHPLTETVGMRRNPMLRTLPTITRLTQGARLQREHQIYEDV